MHRFPRLVCLVVSLTGFIADALHPHAVAGDAQFSFDVPRLPDEELVETYRHAATDNVLAAVNLRIPRLFSVCADGQDFGYGNSYPSLDGHQMTDALLWLGQLEVVKQNWDFVRSFQQPTGRLPLAILPALAGQRDWSGASWEPWMPTGVSTSTGSPVIRLRHWPVRHLCRMPTSSIVTLGIVMGSPPSWTPSIWRRTIWHR